MECSEECNEECNEEGNEKCIVACNEECSEECNEEWPVQRCYTPDVTTLLHLCVWRRTSLKLGISSNVLCSVSTVVAMRAMPEKRFCTGDWSQEIDAESPLPRAWREATKELSLPPTHLLSISTACVVLLESGRVRSALVLSSHG